MTADPYALPGDELSTLWTSKTPVSIALALVVSLVVILFRRRWPERWDRLRDRFSKLAERRALCILAVAIAPVLVRLALLLWSPPFDPLIHDEFGHLLVAHTLLHGRLANPLTPCAGTLRRFTSFKSRPTHPNTPWGRGWYWRWGGSCSATPGRVCCLRSP